MRLQQDPAGSRPGSDGFVRLLARIGCAIIIFTALSTLYVDYVSVYYAYYGFPYLFIPERLGIGLVALSILTSFVRPNLDDVTSLLATLCHFFFFIPTVVMFVYAGLFPAIFIWTIIIQALLILFSRVRFDLAFRGEVPLNVLQVTLVILSLAGLAIAINAAGIFSLNFNIFEVYDRRAEANEADLGILGYIMQLGIQAALLLITVAFFNRERFYTLVGFGFAVLYFGYTGHKSILFWAIFLVGLLYLARFKNKFIYFLMVSTVFIGVIALAMDTELGGSIANFLIRRTLFTPVLLNQYYVMFAEQFGYLNWSYSKIGLGIFEYTDTVSPTQAVGHYLTGSDSNSANTGMIGFGYINAGHFGVAFYVAVFFAILVGGAALAKGKGVEMLGAALMIRASYFAVTTADLPATFLSGGLGYALILLLIYPSRKAVAQPLSNRTGITRFEGRAPNSALDPAN
ncbi:hypothetical protein SAMN06297468_1314 [Altererythrobacter xiamenensis]|uniref:Oligosaccharide repeat unit polymerase n=1 Tax=Altererythrobacter xiamenensis TaxID=1316679 RepID=A0A1Y6F2E1_9SPHN|nr:hypothetical protein [Altererythrobacter xiamenensis]SMQ69068.1 hypothetical protein SAMN06297468_1314 [Altererythrobacter xiamenensis]